MEISKAVETRRTSDELMEGAYKAWCKMGTNGPRTRAHGLLASDWAMGVGLEMMYDAGNMQKNLACA